MGNRDLVPSRPQRWAVGGIALTAGCLLAYGVAGSYTSVAHLASAHDVPLPRLVPVRIDGGLAGTVLLDIVLTWTGFPVWWLRWLGRILTVGMIAANGAAGWPDPVATGLHLAAPVMILAVVEAARSVLLRRPVPGASRREPIPLARWILAPWPTWKLWRRMVLWQVTSYPVAVDTEQRRLRAQYQLRSRYGASWDHQVPDDLAWMLRGGILLEEAFTVVAELTGPHRSPVAGDHAELPARTDDELITDMRARWPGRRPSREAVRAAYRIGSVRAGRILESWDQTPLPRRDLRGARLWDSRGSAKAVAASPGTRRITTIFAVRGSPPGRSRRRRMPALPGRRPRLTSGRGCGMTRARGRQRFQHYVKKTWLPNHRMEDDTRQDYVSAINKHIMWFFGPVKMRDIGSEQVREWITQLKARGVSPRRIEYCKTSILNAIFTTAVEDGVIIMHPSHHVPTDPVPEKPRKIFTPQQFDVLYRALPSSDAQLLVETDIESGLRWGELAELRVKDIDFATGLPGAHVMNQQHLRRPADLLDGRHNGHDDDLDNGAEINVTEPDGSETFRAPLARQYQLDGEDPHVLWLRPVLGSGTPAAESGGLPAFNLSVCRRRGFAIAETALDEHGYLVLTLRGGQTALIQPATDRELETLNRWDEFVLNVLTAEEERDLDRLDTDSWYGRFG